MYDGNQTQAVGALGRGTAMQTPDESSQIRDQVGVSEQLLSDAHDLINAMERRLDAALTPSQPMPAAANSAPKAPTPNGSHLLGRLHMLNDGWRHACHRLTELRLRVEL